MKKSVLRVGVIAAAGKGTRAYPRTSFIPKPLFLFENKTILERNVELQFKILGVERLYIIVGHLKEMVLEEVERIRPRFPGKEILTAEWTGKGLAADIANLRDRIHEDFSVILGDEFYYGTNHEILLSAWAKKRKRQALIAILRTGLLSDIRKNYSVELKGEKVLHLIEKPQDPPNDLLGLGTYVFTKEYFDYFDSTPPSQRSGVVELTEVIHRMALQGGVIASILDGRYFNINSLADYYTANYLIRSEKFDRYRISLVIPSHNNEATLPDVISDFRDRVHEIIVVDTGSEDRTRELARKGKVALMEWDDPQISRGKVQRGVNNGRAVYAAMKRAKGDIIVLVPADGSFRARDLPKLLEYLKDSDMAVGTRTTRQLIEQGSNLNPLNRWLNVSFGKIVEILWWDQEPRFTDIGCIFRALWRDSFEKISPDLGAADRSYSVEMMIEIVRYHMRCIEIPVSYYRRYGSSPDDTALEQFRYFFSLLWMIFGRRFKTVDRLRRIISGRNGDHQGAA